MTRATNTFGQTLSQHTFNSNTTMSCACERPYRDAAYERSVSDSNCCPTSYCSDKFLSLPEAHRLNLVGVAAGSKCLSVLPRLKQGFVVNDGNGGAIVTNQPMVRVPYLRVLLYDESGQPIIAETGNPEEDNPPGVDSLLVSGECGLQWRYRGRAGYRQKLVWDGCKWVVENDNAKELDDYPSVFDGREDCDYLPMVLKKDSTGNYEIGYRSTHYRFPGEIVPYAGALASIPDDFLPCNGFSYDPLEYTALYAAIGFKWGNDSGLFRVPDLRGYFLRGVDHGESVDEDAGTRTAKFTGGNTGDQVGSYQEDALQCHEHDLPVSSGLAGSDEQLTSIAARAKKAAETVISAGVVEGDCGEARTADETRPKNANVEYIIYAGCKE